MGTSKPKTPPKLRLESFDQNDEQRLILLTSTLPTDRLSRRLAFALMISLVANVALWTVLASLVHTHRPPQEKLIEITRVVMNKDKIVPVKLKPKVLPSPKPTQAQPKPVRQLLRPIPKSPPPPAPHVHVVAAPPAPTGPTEPSVIPGGHLAPGTPVASEGTGEQSTPQPVTPPPAPIPVPTPQPAPASPAPKPLQAPTPPPPVGPTQDAEPSNQVKPDIPDDLKQGEYKSFVRVKVIVRADGNFTPVLRTSSGNADIDRRVLEALKRWTWKPALNDGEPTDSVQYFKFEFEVN